MSEANTLLEAVVKLRERVSALEWLREVESYSIEGQHPYKDYADEIPYPQSVFTAPFKRGKAEYSEILACALNEVYGHQDAE